MLENWPDKEYYDANIHRNIPVFWPTFPGPGFSIFYYNRNFLPMFDLEEENTKLPIKKRKLEDYDFGYALAISESLMDAEECQVLTPEEVQKLVDLFIEKLTNQSK